MTCISRPCSPQARGAGRQRWGRACESADEGRADGGIGGDGGGGGREGWGAMRGMGVLLGVTEISHY